MHGCSRRGMRGCCWGGHAWDRCLDKKSVPCLFIQISLCFFFRVLKSLVGLIGSDTSVSFSCNPRNDKVMPILFSFTKPDTISDLMLYLFLSEAISSSYP